ncbi:YidC/Oxa1 family membrane protein insertase [Leifsonia sp. A12D58]|uniref:YidC/Oxa1 family membrane protein insertase n=1 Tax=Leifsonia sp. A12D58 TaxID=3397674 RepID=UPI0039E13337
MDIYTFAPIATILDAAYAVVTALASSLSPFVGTFATALAIVLITLLVRAALIPVGRSQVRAEYTRRRLAPQLQEIQRRYKKNPELMQRKTAELYAAEKASPFAGCLPTLAQAPVLSTVYGLFILTAINGHPNSLLTDHLFQVPLGTSLVHLVGAGQAWPGLLVYAVLLTLIALVAWMSRRAALANAPLATGNAQTDAQPGSLPQLNGILSWMPFITVIFAAIVPLAATLYLAVTTTWTFIERSILRRRIELQLPQAE